MNPRIYALWCANAILTLKFDLIFLYLYSYFSLFLFLAVSFTISLSLIYHFTYYNSHYLLASLFYPFLSFSFFLSHTLSLSFSSPYFSFSSLFLFIYLSIYFLFFWIPFLLVLHLYSTWSHFLLSFFSHIHSFF